MRSYNLRKKEHCYFECQKKYHFLNSNYLPISRKKLLVFSENTWDTNDKDRFPLFGRGTAANSPLMTKWTLIVIVLITTTLITIH